MGIYFHINFVWKGVLFLSGKGKGSKDVNGTPLPILILKYPKDTWIIERQPDRQAGEV